MRTPIAIRWLVGTATVVCLFGRAHALDPNRDPSQYVRESWSTKGGLLEGAVHAIAQTPDGYLWIGTDKGLVRFDGFNFSDVASQSAVPQNDPVLGLVTDAEGGLWVRMQAAGVMRYDHGKFESVPSGPGSTQSLVTAMSRENSGEVLLSDLMSGTVRLRAGKFEGLAPARLLPGAAVTMSMAEMPNGKIWQGTLGAGLFYLVDGKATRVTAGLAEKKINCVLPVGDNELWVGTDHGLFRWNGSVFSRVGLPPSVGAPQVLTILRDRDSNIWVGTAAGLFRINAGGISLSDEQGFRGNGSIDALFEDREGNLWVGGAGGVERIRDSAFVTYSTASGLPSETSGPVYVDSENRTWFATAEGGLYWLKNGRVHTVKSARLDKDVIYSITGRNHEIWVGRQHGGLTLLEFSSGIAAQTYTEANGIVQNSVYAVHQGHDGAVWAGTLSGGVSKYKGGRLVTYTTASGLASNTVASILETHDGTVWFATPNGLSARSNGNWRTYAARNGLPSDNVNCLFEDSSGVLWIGTSDGLAFFSSGRIQVPPKMPDMLRGQIYGLAEDKKGWLWIASSNHVLRVQRDKLSRGGLAEGDVREYGIADGLQSTEAVKRNNSVVTDSSGKIWFSMTHGLSVVDPSHISDSSVPAIPHVEAISADNNTISLAGMVKIPSSHKRITFAYTGLSLAVPERVRFRYFLDGFDRSWSEPLATREAVYTNLSPGLYRFRLIASNSDGVWNGPETVVVVNVVPAIWQTWWFRSACVLVALLTTVLLFRLRLHRLTHQMNERFEERLAERTRIAQELHDTLLQGFLSASMQLHVADDRLPENSPVKPIVSRVLTLMKEVIDDGRNTLRGLRSRNYELRDLAQAFSRIPEEMSLQQQTDYRVIVEGQPRPVHPVIRDDVYRIAREALVNSFRHAQASTIEVEIEYGVKQLRVLVRDNGLGIDPQVLRAGREGHWGLSGMRERAERIGARLTVWTRPAGGTEIELSVPAALAFESKSPGGASKWFVKLYAGRTKDHSDVNKRAV
jgi:signal transduction histidine kinase/ligand-binding sensor domain-containing protein